MIGRTRETIVVMLQAFDRRKDLTEVKTGYRGRELGGEGLGRGRALLIHRRSSVVSIVYSNCSVPGSKYSARRFNMHAHRNMQSNTSPHCIIHLQGFQ